MVTVYPLKLREEIIPILELKSKEEHTNKAVVLKQLIYQSLEEYVLRLCAEGRLSVAKAAEILDKSVYDIHRLSREKGVLLTASEEQLSASRQLVDKLSRRR